MTAWLIAFIAVDVALVAIVIIVIRHRRARRAAVSTDWPIVAGAVVSAEVETHTQQHLQHRPDGGSHTTLVQHYAPRVAYAFSVGGQPFAGDRLSAEELDGRAFRTHREAEDVVARLRVGTPITVRYDPQDPRRNHLNEGAAFAPRQGSGIRGHKIVTGAGVVIMLFAVLQLMVIPLIQLVSGSSQHQGSTTLDLRSGDIVTVFTLSPSRAAAPECTLTGPGAVSGDAAVEDAVYDLSGYRFFPSHGFAVDVGGDYQLVCADEAPFLTGVRPSVFGLRMILLGQLPPMISVVAIGSAIGLFILGDAMKRRASRAPVASNPRVIPTPPSMAQPDSPPPSGPDDGPVR